MTTSSPPPVIALLTDFGTRDPFVGVMKAVILSRCPGAQIIDLSHDIAPQSVVQGAFWLSRCVSWLPPGTVSVAVVDPGVGSSRRAVVLESSGRVFVGPDNGLLAPVLDVQGARAFAIEPQALGIEIPSATFHGRDLFAPVAAEIAAGRLTPPMVGPAVGDLHPSPIPEPTALPGEIRGEVLLVDRFGNLFTNVPGRQARALGDARVEIGPESLPLARTYSDVEPGALLALENAFGVVEVACRDGNAAALLAMGPGARVVLRRVRAGDRPEGLA